MRGKLYGVLLLCSALSLSEAHSTTLNVVQTVFYDFTFEIQSGGVQVTSDPGNELGNYFVYGDPDLTGGSYYPFYRFSFWHYGDRILDLAGETLDLEMLFSSPSPLEEANWDDSDPLLMNPSGSVTFGSDNMIVEWDVSTYDILGWGEADRHWSTPEVVHASWGAFQHLDNPEPYVGLSVYGDMYWGGDNHYYLTNPGRWSTTVQRLCYAGGDVALGSSVACPNPVPPLNGCGPSGGKPRKCDALTLSELQSAPTPVPVPTSMILLASGLAGIGLLRRRSIRLSA